MSSNLQLDDFLQNHIISNIQINESETDGLFFDHTLDLAENTYKKTIMHLDLNTMKTSVLDLPFEADDFYMENRVIILKRLLEDRTVFYSYYLFDCDCRELFQIPFSVDKFAFSDSKLFFTAEVQGISSTASVKCSRRGPFFREGRGVSGDGVVSLFQSGNDGKDISLISSLDMNVDQVDFDLVHNRILFTAFKAEGLKPVDSAVYAFDALDESVSLLFDKTFRISNVISMTENIILFMGLDLNKNSRNDNQQIFKINIETGNVEQLGDSLKQSNENVSVVTDSIFAQSVAVQKSGEYFYYKQIARDREILCRISLKGDKEIVVGDMKTISGYQVTEKGIYLIGLKDLLLSEVYFFNGSELKQVSKQNKWLEERLLVKAEKIITVVENVEIDGYVYAPRDVQPGRLYPAVLMIHGGPKMLYSDVFAHDIQLLCSKGYYVFNANPMGSDGRGDEFSNVRGQFGSLPYKQLMAFTDHVLKEYPQIDEDNLGVSGGSYGGYMTNYIITRTSRFKAAVSERGLSNLMTAFTSSDIGAQFVYEYMGNHETPWSNPGLYMDESPIAGAGQVSTPTLFIHGKDDYTCHYSESLNMYSALNYMGIKSKMCLFEDEGHGLVVRGKPQSKLRRYKEFLSWFDKYLKINGSV